MGHKLTLAILKDIELTKTALRKKDLIRDEMGISENKTGKNSYVISYGGKTDTNNILFDKNIGASRIMDALLGDHQYTILMYDKSIIQVEFIIKNDMIVKERLVFLKKHNKIWNIEEIHQAESEDKDWFSDEHGIPIFLRIDYAPEDYVECSHPATHLTISNSSSCRIPMKRIVMFSEFIKFVLLHFYDIQLDLPRCKIKRDCTITDLERQMMYIDWTKGA